MDEKKELFLQYEKATLAMLSCDAESMEQYIIQRENLANEIDDKSEAIARLCEEHPAARVLMDAAEGRVEFASVPPEFQCVFYGGQDVRSVMSRINQSNAQVMERMQMLRTDALENVRQNKDVPKIKKYLTDLTERPAGGGLRDQKV